MEAVEVLEPAGSEEAGAADANLLPAVSAAAAPARKSAAMVPSTPSEVVRRERREEVPEVLLPLSTMAPLKLTVGQGKGQQGACRSAGWGAETEGD